MHVVKIYFEMFLSVGEWNDDCNTMAWNTPTWEPTSAVLYVIVECVEDVHVIDFIRNVEDNICQNRSNFFITSSQI